VKCDIFYLSLTLNGSAPWKQIQWCYMCTAQVFLLAGEKLSMSP